MKTIGNLTENELKNKRVFLRLDLNVPMADGKIVDDFRIRKVLPTIQFLKKAGARLIIAYHLDGQHSVSNDLVWYNLWHYFRPYLDDRDEILPNLRSHPGEEANDLEFAKELASKADLYVNEAFSASHREHASIVSLPKFLPSYAGILFESEIANLSRAFRPEHPFLFILGGAKLETKVPLLLKFLNIADHIFVGGSLCVKFFEKDNLIKGMLNNAKILLPEKVVREAERVMDVDTESFEKIKEKFSEAKLILWNGPMGFYEKGYVAGSLALAKLIAQSGAYSIVGGGDTTAVLRESGLLDGKASGGFDFVSTGGGAMLQFLATGTLPGIDALHE